MKNGIPNNKREASKFLERLTGTDLSKLLNTPVLSGCVLECAAVSEVLSRRISDILDAEFEEMSPAQKERTVRLTARLSDHILRS